MMLIPRNLREGGLDCALDSGIFAWISIVPRDTCTKPPQGACAHAPASRCPSLCALLWNSPPRDRAPLVGGR
eukprot:1139732-Amorphochlora_amoeboformis.AAC.2